MRLHEVGPRLEMELLKVCRLHCLRFRLGRQLSRVAVSVFEDWEVWEVSVSVFVAEGAGAKTV